MKNKEILIILAVVIINVVVSGAVFAQAACPSGIVSYWKFDEGAELTAGDSVGLNNGTITNLSQWTTGISGGALAFDGLTETVIIPHNPNLSMTGPFSGEAWINLDLAGAGTHRQIITKDDGTAGYTNYNLGMRNDNLIFTTWGISFDGPATVGSAYSDPRGIGIRGSSTLSTGAWHHVAFTYSGSEFRIYLDGVLDGAVPVTGTPSVYNQDVWIGARQSTVYGRFYLRGLIDEVAIYNRALTASEIQQHYSHGLNGFGYCSVIVDIDILPGNENNTINLSAASIIPVAILSSDTFDATTVNPDSVSLAGARVRVVGKSDKYLCKEQDVNNDGLLDLVCSITVHCMTEIGDSVAVLEAETFDGTLVRGEGVIHIVGDN